MRIGTSGWALSLLLLGACTPGATPTSPEAADATGAGALEAVAGAESRQAAADFPFKRILCFGDSITFGVTLQAPELPVDARAELALVEGYVPKLWRRLEERYGTGIELVNAGVGAETTNEGVERIRYEMSVHDPDLVLLLEGVVDINNPAPRFPVVRSNLAGMMDLAVRQGRAVIIGTYPPLNTTGFRTTGAEYVSRLNDVIRQEANKQGVPVADHEKTAPADQSGQGPDGLHPNDIGYEAIADTWFETIVDLVEGPT